MNIHRFGFKIEKYQDGFETKIRVKAPCGCLCVGDGNEKRYWHWCENHPEEGTLYFSHQTKKYYFRRETK